MAFGIKIKHLVTKKEYTIEELYETIKDNKFSAGRPELVKNGFVWLIVFPPLDKNNQVQISPGQMKKPPYSKWTITKGQQAGTENMVRNAVLDHATKGLSGISSNFGKTNKTCEQLVDATLAELQALDL